jgi:flavin-dependent dehydrogenase
MEKRSTDVFVVGGGPAGLALAIAARQAGLDVVVADAQVPPIDKACGEGLLPDTVEALRRLGLQLEAGPAYRVRGIRFVAGGQTAAAEFPDGACGLGVRRTVLHRALVKHCQDAGAVCWWGQPVLGISGSEVLLRDGSIHARWIVGADGARSRVRQWAGLDASRSRGFRYAFRLHYEIPPWADHVEVYWSQAAQVYVTPVGENQVGVALISRQPQLRVQEALPRFPSLAARLRGARVLSRERGAITGMRELHRVCTGHIALVGDASGTMDAITGEGLGLGLRQAALLVDCLRAGDSGPYQGQHEQLAQRVRLIGRMLLEWRKFGRTAAYHMWSAKLWGVAMLAGFGEVTLTDRGGPLLIAAIVLGVLTNVEGTAASLLFREWHHDVPSFWHAMRLARAAPVVGGDA